MLLREQNRGEFTGPIVQLVGRAVGAGPPAVVVTGRSAHAVDGFDYLQGARGRLSDHCPLLR
jgi:hypothetical protein